MPKFPLIIALPALLLPLAACDTQPAAKAGFARTGYIREGALDEVSGMQASTLNPGAFFVHNDDGRPIVYAMDARGASLGAFAVADARNRDWEDMTSVPSADGPLLVLGDTGDNMAQWDHVRLYFVAEPAPDAAGRYSGTVPLKHSIRLNYPDGARDCESLAYDPVSASLLLLSKRDNPPRLYSIPLKEALTRTAANLAFEGEIVRFRPPTGRDMVYFGQRDGPWVAQPTGMDISADGGQAAVISYRSIYLFDRGAGERWLSAMRRPPREFEGPPSRKEEALSYAAGGRQIIITTEGIPAPVYRFELFEAQD